MKKLFLLGAMLCLIGIFASCKDNGDASKATVSHISFTECKNHIEKGTNDNWWTGDPDSVSISYANNTIFITHYNLAVNCGFTDKGILVDINVDGSTITIREYEDPTGLQADCICATDNSFQINNVPPGTYTLVFTNWYHGPYSTTVTF